MPLVSHTPTCSEVGSRSHGRTLRDPDPKTGGIDSDVWLVVGQSARRRVCRAGYVRRRRGGPRVHAPGRDHYLASGALRDLSALFEQLGDQSPNVWWPADRSWIVATEIDFCWTYVAGDRATIDAVLSDQNLEALESGSDHAITFDGDNVNA